MKFLLDQWLPRSAVTNLAALAHDAVHASDIGLSAATDAKILDTARLRGEIVVTLDADFHMLLAVSSEPLPSVIRIRMEGLKGAAVAELVARTCNLIGAELSRGAIASVANDRVRVRLLPIV